MRLPIPAQQPDHIFQVGVALIERGGLRMRTGKTMSAANEQTSIRVTLDHGGIRFHQHAPVDAGKGKSRGFFPTGCRGKRISGLDVYLKVSDG